MTSKKWIDGVNAIGIISKAGKYNGSNPSDEGSGGGYAEINRLIRRRMRCKMKFSEKVKYARMKLLLTQSPVAILRGLPNPVNESPYLAIDAFASDKLSCNFS